jgi:hypothetical protein
VIVAVATSIMVSAFHMLARHEAYRAWGSNDFDGHWGASASIDSYGGLNDAACM